MRRGPHVLLTVIAAAIAALPREAIAADPAPPLGPGSRLPAEQLVGAPVPIYVEVRADVPVVTVKLAYKSFGAIRYKWMEMKHLGDGFAAEIPCDDVSTTGDIKYFFDIIDGDGDLTAESGSPSAPHRVAIRNELEGDPPALPGQKPPQRCDLPDPYPHRRRYQQRADGWCWRDDHCLATKLCVHNWCATPKQAGPPPLPKARPDPTPPPFPRARGGIGLDVGYSRAGQSDGPVVDLAFRVGGRLSDLFSLYYQPTAILNFYSRAPSDGYSYSRAVGGAVYNSVLLGLTFVDRFEIALGPAFDVHILNLCGDDGCGGGLAFGPGFHGRVDAAVLRFFSDTGRPKGLLVGADVHGTVFLGDGVLWSLTAGVGWEWY